MQHTYFIVEGTSRVKIGVSSNPLRRLATLQTGNSFRLELVCTLHGNREKELHTQFARYRVDGEWFNLSSTISRFIASQIGEFDIGRFATLAVSDENFPKQCRRLHNFLSYYKDYPEVREAVRCAHKQWRIEYARPQKRGLPPARLIKRRDNSITPG